MGDGETTVKRFRIYTKTGDAGTSSLYTGQRLPKDCGFFEALGDVDELTSAVGFAREYVTDKKEGEELGKQLAEIQSRLLDVGSAVATPANASQGSKVQRTRFGSSHATALEGQMDALDEELPPLRNFILPSGGKAAAALHVARAVCRRAERSVVALARSTTISAEPADRFGALKLSTGAASEEGGEEGPGQAAAAQEAHAAGIPENSVVDPTVLVYLNRLSDYLFTAARYMAKLENREEVTYQKQ